MNLITKSMKPKMLLTASLITLTLIASACGNKPTESTGGTATPILAPKRQQPPLCFFCSIPSGIANFSSQAMEQSA